MSVCFLNIVNLFAREQNDWKPTGPTSEDIEASRPKDIDTALKHGNLSWVQNFLKQGGDVNASDRMGMPMLASAVFYKHMASVQYLIKHGADINRRCSPGTQGETPLMLAVQSNNLPMVKYLVEHGADLNLIDVSGYTVLTWVQTICPWPDMKKYFQSLERSRQ